MFSFIDKQKKKKKQSSPADPHYKNDKNSPFKQKENSNQWKFVSI